MFKITAGIVAFVLAISTLAIPSAPVPRKAPALSFSESSGEAISLSSFKGKVVALEFLFMRSAHCVRVAQLLNQLNDELRARGFQAVGVAFSAPQSQVDPGTVAQFVEAYRIAFPVGYTDKTDVDRFLNRSKGDVFSIPQVVIIDRAGMIRAQSGPGDPKLEDGASLRALLDSLLKETPATRHPAKTASSSKSDHAETTPGTTAGTNEGTP
jgi:peroxiredoxin